MVKDTDHKHMLEHWHGFPSLHSKAEFILWLQWLCDYNPEVLKDDHAHLDRRGRMVLSTALILEALCYQTGKPATICGACDREFLEKCGDQSLFTFDYWLSHYDKTGRPPDA